VFVHGANRRILERYVNANENTHRSLPS